ncbi:lytic murein transglycosylase [Primorskyibacter aestuariivivens]|uniref:lytic murein transglycosylase n=1 Tax=Primorskyibacter aestuariivivens TaxID=1888912 RepID=UPI002301A616|nr:lytic murein transglycosylase [Primorskyibacter aestuariivivens]MDA7429467.1 lytic murein transglycosylase [Primorskyibacter aestuariivivens]
MKSVFTILVAGLLAADAQAAAIDRSLRPVARPVSDQTESRPTDLAVVQSLRPRVRPAVLSRPEPTAAPVDPAKTAGLRDWSRGFRQRALAQGVSAAVFDRAFRDVRYNADVIARDSNQSEFVKPIWDYLASAASDKRIANGKEMLVQHRNTLAEIEDRYGVAREVVVAVWGMESAYGEYRGSINVVEALATLAYDGRRGRFFEQQLIAALKILQNGDTAPSAMTGSWAGAMGHTQFIPTSYEAYAVDFRGDGRRDIWSDDPTDALASTAAYLSRFGWIRGMPWGVEVRLPEGFDYGQVARSNRKMPSQWAQLGVLTRNGRPVPDYGAAYVLLPAGSRGAAFLVFKNFDVIKRYNAADAYALGVGHLSDRLIGGGPIEGGWPTGDRALTRDERKELQRRLTARGFNTRGVDGRIGPNTVKAIRGFQRSAGLTPDGHASHRLLQRLR